MGGFVRGWFEGKQKASIDNRCETVKLHIVKIF